VGVAWVNVLSKTLISLVIIAVVIVVLDLAGVFSLREFTGIGEMTPAVAQQNSNPESGAKDGGTDWARPANAGDAELDFQDVQQVFSNLDANRKKAFLEEEESFRNFIRQEAGNLSVLEAARINKVDQDQNTVFLMQRAADNILRESYINKLMVEKFPAEFPSDEQIKEFYENNKDKFVLGERVHVWQIFLNTEKIDKAEIAGMEKKAGEIQSLLKQGKLDFAAAALKYSEHHPSRENGGDMGLLKVSELKPEISRPLLALKEGELSPPIKSETGIHILKRGAIVPQQDVGLDQIRSQLVDALKNQARTQFRKAIYEQAAKTYPVELSDNKIEEWRLRLRTDMP